jgi:hypothetical protein
MFKVFKIEDPQDRTVVSGVQIISVQRTLNGCTLSNELPLKTPLP